MKNWLFLIILLFLGILGINQAYTKNSCCFHPSLVTTKSFFLRKTNSPPPEVILAQTFHFIGSGHQSFAFESEDQSYVLKLLKFHHVDAEKMISTFEFAMKSDPYAQISYLHFPNLNEPTFPLLLKDRASRLHYLKGNEFFFILQKKAITTNQALRVHFQNKELGKVKEKLTLLFEMINSSLKAGIYDRDHNVIHNTGFAGNSPMRIDFGKISYNPLYQELEWRKTELLKIASERILPWVERYYPIYKEEIKDFMDNLLETTLLK